jgi:4-amino-4-deoxy-L-arabinose transferase-like glycosyltransferase
MSTPSTHFPLTGLLPARIAAGIILVLGIAARIGNLDSVQARTPDERVYTRQAMAWLQHGDEGIRSLVAEYESKPENRFYPQPSRVMMIRMVAATMQLTGKYDERAAALLSCTASIVSLLIVAFMGVRYFPPIAGIVGLILYAVSPPALAIARRAWSDALVEMIALAMVCLTCEITRGARQKSLCLALAVLGAIGLGIKELSALTFAICFVWIVSSPLVNWRDWRNEVFLFVSCVVAVTVSVVWMVSVVGSVSEFLRLFTGATAAIAYNPYAIEYTSGPPYLMARTVWIASPVTSLAGLAGLSLAFLRGDRIHRWLACFTLVYFATTLMVPNMINLRYLSPIYGTLCLFTGLALAEMILFAQNWKAGSERMLAVTAATIIVAGGAVADYDRFRRFFVRDAIADLSIKILVDEQRR